MRTDLLLCISLAAMGLLIVTPCRASEWHSYSHRTNMGAPENVRDKSATKRIAVGITGVLRLHNRQRARSSLAGPRGKLRWAERFFKKEPYLTNPNVRVRIKDSAVVLQGSVDTQFEKLAEANPHGLLTTVIRFLERLIAGCSAARSCATK